MAHIKLNSLVFAVFLKIFYVDGRILPGPFYPRITTMSPDMPESKTDRIPLEKILGLENMSGTQSEKYNEEYSHGENTFFGPDDRCAILVMSNQGHTSIQQSLLRKYRYNKDGDLIPGSVQYFIKFPQGSESSAVLVPLKDKAFSPSGGFVRYYKEVPPIPQSWRR